MAFWCRINQSKLKHLTHPFKKYYSQIHGPSLQSYPVSHTKSCITAKSNWGIHLKPSEFCTTVRFFAAPLQVKPKKGEKDTSGPRLNDQINAQVLRLVTDEGHYIVSRNEGLERARKLKLDLVEVQRHVDPPVCKIMDFHKERYRHQLKEKDRAKNKSEVTFEENAKKFDEQKDLKVKADTVKRLIERGYRVKCMAFGPEDQDLGGALSRLFALIEDVSVVESGPSVVKRQAYVIVMHVKFGTSKKGGKNKSKVARPSPAESGLGNEDENLSDEEDKTAWSILDASDEPDKVFDFSDDVNWVRSETTNKHMNVVPKTASSPAKTNVPNFLPLRSALYSMRENTSLSSAPSLQIANRYKKCEPINRFPATKSVDYKSPGAKDSVRSEPRFSYQRIQPPSDLNVTPSTGDMKRFGQDASIFRNFKLPKNEMPEQELSRPSTSNISAPSYGIFSAPKPKNLLESRVFSTESLNVIQDRISGNRAKV